MYIRYNNSSPQKSGQSSSDTMHGQTPLSHGQNNRHENRGGHQGQNHHHSNPPPKNEKKFKNPLKFLPEEVYNPKTHKFFGKISGEDILLIGLILMVLDSGCDDDLILALALFYILLSDYFDFGNILF